MPTASASEKCFSRLEVFAMMRSKSSPPRQSSVTMWRKSGSSKTSTTSMMFGWRTAFMISTSRLSISGRCTRDLLMLFTAKRFVASPRGEQRRTVP